LLTSHSEFLFCPESPPFPLVTPKDVWGILPFLMSPAHTLHVCCMSPFTQSYLTGMTSVL
jgi:hypothetical protein